MELRAAQPRDVGFDPSRFATVRALCEGWVESGHIPALVVLLARRGAVVLHEAWGRLAPEPDAPALPLDAIYPCSSLAKVVTATAAMQLVEDGLLGLNRPAREYLPEIDAEGADEMLVHHLLTHTSGYNDLIVDQETARSFQALRAGEIEIAACPATAHRSVHLALELGWNVPLWKKPGAECSYSSHGFELVGEIVRRVSGQSLPDFVQERIFDPLGMVDSYLSLPEELEPRLVRRGDLPLGQPDGAWPGLDSRKFAETPWAASGLASTAADLARFGRSFLGWGKRILSPATIRAMTRNQIPGTGVQFGSSWHSEASFGYGWMVASDESWKYFSSPLTGRRAYVHGGAGGAWLWIDPDYELVGVWLSVATEVTDTGEHKLDFEEFQNAALAAVVD